jgi:DNA-binding transcriptional LysR family regulator
VEFRQLRYFVTLAEELHFGRAAAREHIVQSALSQQLKRLERELGVPLLSRTTHQVQLTAAGSALLDQARQILAHVDRAAATARHAAGSPPTIHVGTMDASNDSMPLILHQVRQRHPNLEIHEIEVGVPQQLELLLNGRLDVGIGRASVVPSAVAAELIRLDPLGVLLADGHRLAVFQDVPVSTLAHEVLLLAKEDRAPEFNQFLIELCRSVGFLPTVYPGTVESTRAAAHLVARGLCVACAPASCLPVAGGTIWRPLVEPVPQYPWSVLWRSGDGSEYVHAVIAAARGLSRQFDWLQSSIELNERFMRRTGLLIGHHRGDRAS